MKRNKLFVLGFFIHIIFLLSIFDIYFKSPIVQGIIPQNNDIGSNVSRVVFISVDGLRFDSMLSKDTDTEQEFLPYVNNVIQKRGMYGVSQTHVPTESRPGHVAMLAGIYEDPSAVTRGWKKNPVDFDSLFNRSGCSFSWGSPDILNVFYEGLVHPCAFYKYYDEHEQQFAGNTMALDNWVFEEARHFLRNNAVQYKDETKLLFFLHLLGQDTSGHADKPNSRKYNDNLRNVDKLVEKIEDLFEELFPDKSTCYIFSSDHGMTDWGSHGSGDPSETDVPIVAWGAGIKHPNKTHPTMVNISQADITPLVAILLGVPIPVNSIGVLPTPYLNASQEFVAKSMLLNAKQMTAQLVRMAQIIQEQSLPFLYSPFGKLTEEELDSMLHSVSINIVNKQYEDAILKCNVLISLSLEGLEYLQNYYQFSLLFCIILSYLAWILYLSISLVNQTHVPKKYFLPNVMISVIVTVTVALIMLQNLPVLFYCYFVLPELLWFFIVQKQDILIAVSKKAFGSYQSMFQMFLIIGGLELLVVGFFHRWVLSLPMICIVLWPFLSKNFVKIPRPILLLWVASGVMLALFSLLPVVGKQPQVNLIITAGFLLFALAVMTCVFSAQKVNLFLSVLRCSSIALATYNAGSVHNHFQIHHELFIFNQTISWFLFVLSVILSVSGPVHVQQRLQHVFMGISIPFILLSVSHEGFFLLALFTHLYCWLYLENQSALLRNIGLSQTDGNLNFSDFRKGFLFLCYISIAFFGIGNIASLNSFDPAWVRCFLTLFSPFTMTFLILFKTVIPFLAVICTVHALYVTADIKPERIFIIVLIYCNIMGLNFLFLVTNKGSWLEIGTSISHYVIQQVTVLFIVLLYIIAQQAMTFSLERSVTFMLINYFENGPTFDNNYPMKRKTHNS